MMVKEKNYLINEAAKEVYAGRIGHQNQCCKTNCKQMGKGAIGSRR